MKKRSLHPKSRHKHSHGRADDSAHVKWRNRALAFTVFSIIVFGALMDMNPDAVGNVVSIMKSDRVHIDSYSVPATSSVGEAVAVEVYLTKSDRSFPYGRLKCDIRNVRGRNMPVDELVTFEPECVQLPQGNSFTMKYYFVPYKMDNIRVSSLKSVQGRYYNVESCTITTSPYDVCTGAKFDDRTRQPKSVLVQ